MFVIFEPQRHYYFSNNNKIILFKDIDKAHWFVENFYDYSLQRALSENFNLMPVMSARHTTMIKEVDFDMTKVETIDFDDLNRL